MKKNCIQILQVLLIFIFIISSEQNFYKHVKGGQDDLISGQGKMVGGWETVDLDTDDNQQIIDEAVSYLNDNIIDCPDKSFQNWQLDTLEMVRMQVVAGLNIQLEGKFIKKDNTTGEQKGKVLLWMHPMNSKTHEAPIDIQSCEWIN